MKSPLVCRLHYRRRCFSVGGGSQTRKNPPRLRNPRLIPCGARHRARFRDSNGLKMKLVWCPPGAFTNKVGYITEPAAEKSDRLNDDEDDPKETRPAPKPRMIEPNHVDEEVLLTEGYWLGKYEVTQSEWKLVMKTEPWKGEDFAIEGADYPATFVSWDDATDFCRKLTEQERQAGRLPKNWEYTLPTEAQWEHGCRARTKTKFSFGDDESKLGDYAWFGDNARMAGECYAHQVGQKKANPWGLCDMHGNVWEWSRDRFTEKLPGGRDPEVKPDEKTKGSGRVTKGGAWNCHATACHSAVRAGGGLPADRAIHLGFRAALTSVRSVQ